MRFWFLLLGVFGALWAGDARAHAVLVAADPADGASIAAPPPHVVLRFNEDIALIDARIIDDSGAVVMPPHAPFARDETVVVPLPSAMRAGTYLVSYRITSADSHPVAGSVIFAIGGAADRAAVRAFAPTAGERWRGPAIMIRAMLLAVAALVAGAVLFALLVAPLGARLRRNLGWAALLGLVCAIANLAVRAALLGDAEPAALLDAATWRPVFLVPFGGAMILAGPGFALAAAGLLRSRSGGRENWPTIVGAAATIASLPLSGHAAGVSPVWLGFSAASLHVTLACFWLGAFVPLLAALRGDPAEAAATVRRFSRRAMPAVGILVGAGVILALVQLGDPAALFDGAYGTLLLVKLALVGGLIALACWNRLRLVAALETRGRARPLALAIGAEIIVGLAVLTMSATLGMTPPRVGSPTARDDHHDHAAMGGAGLTRLISTGRITAAFDLNPGRAGRNRLDIVIVDADDRPLVAREVTVEITLPGRGVAAITRRLRAEAPGRYALEGPEFAIAGTWRLRVDVLISDFVLEVLETEFELR